ncbi:hypothetical protein EDEG_03927 [Edhazardia aedis USNM 41457]|uniref:Uncharacterized protein n=1 Tax=Edhazardia aedis (strain USNM 41457) TaxID=1003232 RepID=J9D0T9_EDHAE|nr:hypothetical protein EDEG_03927 [Edhazardia aedis USNM 41457]|eukprot:EJW01486.1 hypothetical protein EDEG_03927 [Edhazardia aedis USNM 41457]
MQKTQEKKSVQSIDNIFSAIKYQANNDILSMKSYIEKISFLKNVLIVKICKVYSQDFYPSLKIFAIKEIALSKSKKGNDNQQCQDSNRALYSLFFPIKNNLEDKKNKKLHFFVCLEESSYEWFFPNEKCENFIFNELNSESSNGFFSDKEILLNVLNQLKIVLRNLFAQENNNHNPKKVIISSSNTSKHIYYVNHKKIQEKQTKFSPEKPSSIMNLETKDSVLENGKIISNDITIDKFAVVDNIFFFIFSREKISYAHNSNFFKNNKIDADFLLRLNINYSKYHLMYQKICETYNFYYILMVNYENIQYRLHKKYDMKNIVIGSNETIELTHIKHWKIFLLNYCTKSPLFLLLMGGIENFICECYFNCDNEIYKILKENENYFLPKNRFYTSMFLYFLFFFLR